MSDPLLLACLFGMPVVTVAYIILLWGRIDQLTGALCFYGDPNAYITFKRKEKGRIHAVKSRVLHDRGRRARITLWRREMDWLKLVSWLLDLFSWGDTLYHNVRAWHTAEVAKKTAQAEANIPVTDKEWEEGGREGSL